MTISTDLLLQMAAIGLAGQTVMVTGGSGCIGAAITKMFKAADCNVVVIGSNQSKLDDLVKSLDKGNGQVWAYVCDIRDPKQVDDMIRKAVDDCPPIDILINNAGYALSATVPFWDQDIKDVASVMDVNLNGLLNVTRAVLKHHMIPRDPSKGTIVNISSITGHQAPLREGFEASYHTSKAGVEGFSNVLRHEVLGTNIRVLVHRPGTVRTEFHSRRLGYDEEKTDAMFEGQSPLAPEDIAVGVLWQCLQPERISVVMMETLGTAQRSLYSVDKEWVKRNGPVEPTEWKQ